jgi:hypothetical protein
VMGSTLRLPDIPSARIVVGRGADGSAVVVPAGAHAAAARAATERIANRMVSVL